MRDLQDLHGGVQVKVYVDNSATTRTDPEVVRAMEPYFVEKYGNASSLHQWGQEASEALKVAREAVAKRVGASPKEIVFTSGGTESDNLAIKGAVYANKEKGTHIITSKIEHPAVLNTCKELEKEGFKVTYLGVDSEGFVDLEELKKSITPKTVLVSIMHANNEIGTIQDIGAMGKICHEKGVLFHTDAVQSFTKVEIDVAKDNVDLMSMSSHKIHGPNGVGALYIKKGVKVKKLSDGGHHEFDVRGGTENVPGAMGFAKAVMLAGPEGTKKMEGLRDYLIDRILKEIPGSSLNGTRNKGKRLCNNVNVAFRHIEGESILLKLDMNGIAVSTGSACSSQSLEPSHVLLAIGMRHEDAHGSIRFSLSRENTKEEMDYIVENLKEVVAELRKLSPLGK